MTTISERQAQFKRAKQAQALMVEGMSTDQACDKAGIDRLTFLRIADIPRVPTAAGSLVKSATMARARQAEKLMLDGMTRKEALEKSRISQTSYVRCGLSFPPPERVVINGHAVSPVIAKKALAARKDELNGSRHFLFWHRISRETYRRLFPKGA